MADLIACDLRLPAFCFAFPTLYTKIGVVKSSPARYTTTDVYVGTVPAAYFGMVAQKISTLLSSDLIG